VFGEIAQGNFDLFNPPRFTGGGQKLRLRVQLGTERQDYLLSFVEPWFLGKRLQLGVDLYHHEWNFQSLENLYDEKRTGGHVGLLRELPRPEFIQRISPSSRIIGGIGYRLEQVGIDFNGHISETGGLPDPEPNIPHTLLSEEGNTLISKFDASLSFDTRGPGMLPEKGQQTELYGEIAGPWGGEKNYFVLGMKTHWYFKGLFPGHILEVLGGIKASDSWGNTEEDTPFYDRFYLGGINDLRGFRYRSVGPREKGSGSKEPIGGDSYWLGSIEYSLPIIERLRVAVFYDVGDVQRHPWDFSAGDYSDNWGLGLRLNLPIGGKQGMPLRLDYGIPIHFQDRWNSGSGQFQFSAGFDRPF
jgi:outer membrane protein insertion porin family